MAFEIPIDVEQKVAEMPVGEDFPRTGFIGGWQNQLRWKVGWFETDLDVVDSDVAGELPNPVEDFVDRLRGDKKVLYDHKMSSRAGNMHQYYYDYSEKDRALALCEVMDREESLDFQRTPRLCWFMAAALEDIISLNAEARAKFNSDPLTFDIEIMTLKSKKNRHAWHFMALPSFVAAYATAQGIENPGFDLSALTVPEDQLIFNDELQTRLIGNGDIGYADSQFWLQRTALWKALGEDNPDKSQTIEAATKLSTDSKQLDELLQPTGRPWLSPVYCRVIPVPDPRVGAAYGKGDNKKQLSVPVITEFYENRDAAVAAAAAERGTEDEGDASGAPVISGLRVPEAWKTSPDGWEQQVADIREKLVDVPPPLWKGAVSAMLEKGTVLYLGFILGATVEEVMDWLAEV